MYTVVRVSADELSPERLDTGFYSKAFFDARKLIIDSGFVIERIGDVCEPWQFGAYALCNNIVWSTKESGVPFIKAEAIESPLIDDNSLSYVTHNTHDLLEKSALSSGDIIVSTSGTVGRLAVLPDSIPKANSNQDTIKFSLKNTDYDSYFVASWLCSKYAQAFMNREAGGAVQQHIYLYNFKRLPLLKTNSLVQRYIGDKVRQAERLRALGKKLAGILQEMEGLIPVKKPHDSEFKYSVVKSDFFSENRLDAKFYERKHLELDEQFNENFQSLGYLSNNFKYGASVKADYVESSSGIKFIRGNAISKNDIQEEDMVFLNQNLLLNLEGSRVSVGDILITRSGTVGVSSDVFEGFSNAAYGSFIIKCVPRKEIVTPTYLSWYLNSWVGQQQFRRWENGAVQLNINIEELSSIMVWIAPPTTQEKITSHIFAKREADRYSKHLTTAAKLLVEGLIEGLVTETELIAAQQGLEAGDTEADAAILRRLKTDGLDGKGQPLFGDVERVYELLKDADQYSFQH